jgi:hypothetical protein
MPAVASNATQIAEGWAIVPAPALKDGPMTDAAALELRHVRLAEPVTLRPASLGPTPDGGVEEGVFVALDDSPPVRTVLAVVEGGRRRALEVAWVVEVTERDEVKGFYGRWVADEALERAAKVGTEHLEDGTPVVQPVVHDNSAGLDMSDAAMAMPAPVVLLDGSDDDDDGEDGDGDSGLGDEGEQPSGSSGYELAGRTIIDPDYQHPEEAGSAAQAGETVSDADDQHARETTAGSSEQAASEDAGPTAEAETAGADDAAESSTDSGEASSESSEPGDAGDSRSRGRKKRGRRRR